MIAKNVKFKIHKYNTITAIQITSCIPELLMAYTVALDGKFLF